MKYNHLKKRKKVKTARWKDKQTEERHKSENNPTWYRRFPTGFYMYHAPLGARAELALPLTGLHAAICFQRVERRKSAQEKPGKHSLSQVVKVNTISDTSC